MEEQNGYRFREPAEKTINFMNEQSKFNQSMQISMNDLRHDIKDLCKSLGTSNEVNESQHEEIIKRLGRMEKFGLAILVIFALSALYFIFMKVGLPTP